MRETCGAACGMFMLAGLAVEGTYPDAELKKRNYEVVQHLAQAFRQENGSLICAELLGLSPRQPHTDTQAEARTPAYYAKRPCAQMVESAARLFAEFYTAEHSA